MLVAGYYYDGNICLRIHTHKLIIITVSIWRLRQDDLCKAAWLCLFIQGQQHLSGAARNDYCRAGWEMENKTKDSQIHATGGSVKKLLHTPTQCRPHTHTHTSKWWHTKKDSYTNTHKHNGPEASFENLKWFFFSFSRTIWGRGREKVQQRCRLSSYLFIRVHLSPCRQHCMRTSDGG